MGVPTLGCDCRVCTSSDPRDRRTRPSIAIAWAGHRVIIDTGPDFRTQALREGIDYVDAVFYTHSHADHVLGLDDLRPLSFKHKGKMPLYADDSAATVIERIFDYTFDPNSWYPTRARVEMHRLGESVEIDGAVFQRVPLTHGRIEVAGFRFGNAAYLTDMNGIPESSLLLLQDLDVVIHGCAAEDSASQPRQSGTGCDAGGAAASRSVPSLPICRMSCCMRKPMTSFLRISGWRMTGCGSLSRFDHARISRSQRYSGGLGSTVVSIGNFDGVHVGHRFVIDQMRKSAAARGARSVAVTFDPHPLRFLRPETCPRLITPLKTRLELLEDAGLDAVLVLPFTANFARLRATEFVTTIVHDVLRAAEVHEGPNFRFGYRAEGGTAELTPVGQRAGVCGGNSLGAAGAGDYGFKQQDSGAACLRGSCGRLACFWGMGSLWIPHRLRGAGLAGS